MLRGAGAAGEEKGAMGGTFKALKAGTVVTAGTAAP